ncbi:MAG: polynucleotide adenylyltransferase PcnB [Succinivibrionaceae bacterium]|nr:polynucleotide adenylyltransferase PcnB [Succinivibrionaceae bacterium]
MLKGVERQLEESKERVEREGEWKLVIPPSHHGIAQEDIPRYAIRVIEGLVAAGYQAYLVGGGVRDLLLGFKPKDFDISTNATPEQVCRVFTNSRIIGRRFRIVHVVFQNVIVEVTTFRSNQSTGTVKVKTASTPRRLRDSKRAENVDGMLVRDNFYGRSIEEDAERRDFTINAIYYDLRSHSLIDFHGGLYDLTHGIIDIIGDPEVRYAEDPVRMIRALRFAAKLGFTITDRTAAPILECADRLTSVSNNRLYDEVNKLFLSGHGAASFRILKQYHFLGLLFPQLGKWEGDRDFNAFTCYALDSSDQRYREDKRNMPHFLYCIMLWKVFMSRVLEAQALNTAAYETHSVAKIVQDAAEDVLRKQYRMTAIPYTTESTIGSIWRNQYRLLSINDPETVADLTSKRSFRGSFDFLKLRANFEPYLLPYVAFWQPHYDVSSRRAQQLREVRDRQDQEQFDRRSKRRQKYAERSPEAYQRPTAAEDNDRLARARAWRAAMHLDP